MGRHPSSGTLEKTNIMTTTGNEFLAQALRAAGTSHFFHVPVVVPEAVKAMSRLGITPVVAHTEKAAAYMADGYARVAGRPGVCGCQAIGATNLAAGLRDACMARVPIIALTGGSSTTTRYRSPYQEIDDMPIYAALSKFNASVEEATRLPDLLFTAFRAATCGSPGPVHLEIGGFTGSALNGACATEARLETRFHRYPGVRAPASSEEIARGLAVLQAAERPIIVAGAGVRLSGAGPLLCELARRMSIPVATSLSGKGSILESDPLAVGVVGEYSRECANRAVYEADAVLYVGSLTGGLVTRNWSVPATGTRVVHIDINPENIGRNYLNTIGICGDARTVLEQMLSASVPSRDRVAWLGRIAALKADWARGSSPLSASDAVPIRPERLASDLSRELPGDAIVVGDTGHSAAWLAQYVEATQPGQTFIRCHGSLGWSFPAALGAQCAAPDRPVICFTGDGAFYYHLAELETAVRYGLNVVTVLNDNAGFNQEQGLWPEGVLSRNWKFGKADFVAIAEAFGCVGLRVTAPSELRSALRAALQMQRPVVLDVLTDDKALAATGWGPEGMPPLFSTQH